MKKTDSLNLLFYWLLAIIACIWICSCSVDRQARVKTAWLIAHDRLDDVCARIYPVRDSLVVRDSIAFDTLYQESEVFLTDTVYLEGAERIVMTKCPPHQVITKTVRKDSLIYRTNSADVDRMKGEVLDVQRQLKQKDDIIITQQRNLDKDNWWKMAAIVTWFVIVLGIVFRLFIFKKPI